MPVSGHPYQTNNISTLHHQLRYAGCLNEIILGDQQVTLLGNTKTIRRLPFHARSPSRSCLHLVLVPLKCSFGILISERFLSRTGDLNPIN